MSNLYPIIIVGSSTAGIGVACNLVQNGSTVTVISPYTLDRLHALQETKAFNLEYPAV